jgi:hypothetical protein
LQIPPSLTTATSSTVQLAQSPPSITLLSIFLPAGYCFRNIAGHGVECQAMAAKY